MDDFADRTLPPTERRRREARLRGDVARSDALAGALLLFATSVLLWFLINPVFNSVTKELRLSLSRTVTVFTIDSVPESTNVVFRTMAMTVGPILIGAVLASLVGRLVQTGWIWNTGAMTSGSIFRNPISWTSSSHGLFSLLSMATLALILWTFVNSHVRQLQSLSIVEPAGMLIQTARLVVELAIQLACGLVLVGLVDYGFHYWCQEQRLKMTIEERRQEQRDEETDPQTRKRRAEVARAMRTRHTQENP